MHASGTFSVKVPSLADLKEAGEPPGELSDSPGA